MVGRRLREITTEMGEFARLLGGDTQYRWLGPDKGVIHLAAAAVVNAVWDLWAQGGGRSRCGGCWRRCRRRRWCSLIDFSYIEDALTPVEALGILERNAGTRGRAGGGCWSAHGPGGVYDVGGVVRVQRREDQCGCATRRSAEGWTYFKLKVGGTAEDDLRRGRLVRERDRAGVPADGGCEPEVGRGGGDPADAGAGGSWTPWWMEEPTSPDDILGHARIRRETGVRIATGEHCHSKVMFKQMFQAGAIDVCQIDSCRVAGVNENLAIILMAAKFGVPVCPHAGGVGLCEYVQHLAAFDFMYAMRRSTMRDRVVEFVDHLHEHFVTPVRMSREGAT